MSICQQCGAPFVCAVQDGKFDIPCWCAALPKLALGDMPANAGAATAACLCPDCLKVWIASRAAPAQAG